ncbi:hypothetical protein GCM10009193_29010 [Shewanella aestuarii]|nr:hypothetical protein GCM10009193_29010 [Shewanella aestuarii]
MIGTTCYQKVNSKLVLPNYRVIFFRLLLGKSDKQIWLINGGPRAQANNVVIESD